MRTRPALPVRRLAFSVLIVTMSTQPVFVLGASFFQIGPELGLGPAGLGFLTAAFFLTAAAASPAMGRWVQRVGWRRAARVNVFGSGLVMVGIAALGRASWSMGALLVGAAAIYGLANPAANAALAEVSTAGRRATLFGIKHAGIPGSTMVAGALVPVVVVVHGWRWAMVAGAGLALVVRAVMPPESGAGPTDVGPDDEPPAGELSTGYLVGLGLASALATWAATGLGSFLVSASLARGIDESAAGLLLTAGSLASIVARVVVGRVTDRRSLRATTGLTTLMATGAIVFWLLPAASGGVYFALILVAFMTGWAWPGLMTYAVVNANRASVAASSAITQAGVFLGAGVGPFVLGQIAEHWSYDAMWVAVGVALAAAASGVWTVRLLRAGARSTAGRQSDR